MFKMAVNLQLEEESQHRVVVQLLILGEANQDGVLGLSSKCFGLSADYFLPAQKFSSNLIDNHMGFIMFHLCRCYNVWHHCFRCF